MSECKKPFEHGISITQAYECTEFIGLGDCPYCEIDRLKEEVEEQKGLVHMILAEAYKNGL